MQNADDLQGMPPAPDAEQTEIEAVAEAEVVESESSTDEVEETGEQPKKVGGVAKRIDELTRNWREEQRRAQKLEQMLEQVISRPAEQKQEPSAPPQPQGEPKLDQFQTYEEYVKAVGRWEARQEIEQIEEQRRQRELQSQQQAKQVEFQSRLQAAKTEMPDFDEVALNPSLPVSDTMAELIREMDDGPKVLYALGKSPDVAARIASLPPTLAAVELGRFAVKASLPQPRTVTNAPPPVNPLSGGIGTRNADPDKMTDQEWAEWRRQQLKR